MDYWTNKFEMAAKARKHTSEMKEKHHDDIMLSIENSVVYGFPDREPEPIGFCQSNPRFVFANIDSVSAIFKFAEGKTAVLNFASYKNAGGMFMSGSSAQEESLCHESFLYNVLRHFSDYYEWNNNHKNRAFYENRAIYSPDIIFEHKSKSQRCDVITCASPNLTAITKYQNPNFHVSGRNESVFRQRVLFLRKIAEEQKVDTLILGAWGCGVFGQNPWKVAKTIKEVFKHTNIKKIVLAVPGTDENSKAFHEEFGVDCSVF